MKKGLCALVFGIFLCFNAEAFMVSFLVVETGLPYEAESNRYSAICEDVFMNSFFESGFIVSNFPILRLEYRLEGNIVDDLGLNMYDARTAGANIIMIIALDFPSGTRVPASVSIYIYSVSENRIVLERQAANRNYRTEREASDDFRSLAFEMARFIGNM